MPVISFLPFFFFSILEVTLISRNIYIKEGGWGERKVGNYDEIGIVQEVLQGACDILVFF